MPWRRGLITQRLAAQPGRNACARLMPARWCAHAARRRCGPRVPRVDATRPDEPAHWLALAHWIPSCARWSRPRLRCARCSSVWTRRPRRRPSPNLAEAAEGLKRSRSELRRQVLLLLSAGGRAARRPQGRRALARRWRARRSMCASAARASLARQQWAGRGARCCTCLPVLRRRSPHAPVGRGPIAARATRLARRFERAQADRCTHPR